MKAWLADPRLRRAVVIVIALRVVLQVVAVISERSPIYPNGEMSQLWLGHGNLIDTLVEPWQRFDAFWYDYIARNGYATESAKAFCPLYPFLIAVFGGLLHGSYALAELLISTVAAAVAFWLLAILVEEDFGIAISRRTVLFTAVAPTAFFLFAGYTEALFLALSVGVFLAARRGKFITAGVLCGLCILCRIQGVLLFAPLLVEVGLHLRRGGLRKSDVAVAATALALPLLTFAAMTQAFRAYGLGWGPVAAQSWWGVRTAMPWSVFTSSIAAIQTGGHPEEMLNLFLGVLLVLSIPLMFRRMPASYGVYALGNAFVTWFHVNRFSPMMSTARFYLVLFPLFVLFAMYARKPRITAMVAGAFGAEMLLFFDRYVHFKLVG